MTTRGQVARAQVKVSAARASTKAKAKAAATEKKPHPIKDGPAARFRVLPGTPGHMTGSKVEGKISSATEVELSSGEKISTSNLFPLDEWGLMMMEVAAVWRATPSLTLRTAHAAWKRGRDA